MFKEFRGYIQSPGASQQQSQNYSSLQTPSSMAQFSLCSFEGKVKKCKKQMVSFQIFCAHQRPLLSQMPLPLPSVESWASPISLYLALVATRAGTVVTAQDLLV